MRLIDADALYYDRVTLDGDDEVVAVVLRDDIDAAPTVSCEECEHEAVCVMNVRLDFPDGDSTWHDIDACSHFERRQP